MGKTNKDYLGVAREVFNTPRGIELLRMLKEDHVDVSSLHSTPELTYYYLGRKELVQELIAFVKDPDILHEVEQQENIYD